MYDPYYSLLSCTICNVLERHLRTFRRLLGVQSECWDGGGDGSLLSCRYKRKFAQWNECWFHANLHVDTTCVWSRWIREEKKKRERAIVVQLLKASKCHRHLADDDGVESVEQMRQEKRIRTSQNSGVEVKVSREKRDRSWRKVKVKGIWVEVEDGVHREKKKKGKRVTNRHECVPPFLLPVSTGIAFLLFPLSTEFLWSKIACRSLAVFLQDIDRGGEQDPCSLGESSDSLHRFFPPPTLETLQTIRFVSLTHIRYPIAMRFPLFVRRSVVWVESDFYQFSQITILSPEAMATAI